MGVTATYCQLCGLPVQHDHYVPLEGGMLGIFRGGESDQFTPVVAFGPDHEWLRDAVGLRLDAEQEPPLISGAVHDGEFDDRGPDGFVWDGLDQRAALHRLCFVAAGKPDRWPMNTKIVPPLNLEPYQQQLFDFAALVKDGLGWALVDPRRPTDEGRRSRERVDRAAASFRPPR
jgi:hypothetical protein